MPLTYSLCNILHDDCGVFTIQNNTDYVAGGTTRGAAGEKLIVAYVNSDEIEAFITVDSVPYDSKISYDITNTLDGHYHAELLRFTNYNAGTAYIAEVRDVNNIITSYANLIYYPTTQKFYKNILASTGIAPDAGGGVGAAHWQEITNFQDSEVRLNTTISVGILDFIYDCRSRKCVKNELYKIVNKDPACIDEKLLLSYWKKAIYLLGAKSKASDQKFDKAEIIIRTLSNICDECSTGM